jgi:predicted MFS family arabinose efflux permease
MQLKTNQDLAYGIAGLLTASVGYLILLFLPVYLEVVALSLSLSEQEVGRLASTDSAGIVVATILFASFVSKLNFRKVAFLGVLISVVGNLLSGAVDSFYLLCLVRLVCGVGEGLLVAVGISALGMTSSPNRWFGYYTAAVVIVQAIGLAAVPFIYQSSGLFFVFFAIAIFYMLPLLVLKKLPKDSNGYGSVVTESKPSYVSKKLFWLAIMGLLSFYIGIGAVWSYISFLATDSGLPLDTVSQSLSLSMLAGLLGALFFAWLNKKGKSSILLFVSFAIMSACLIAVLTNLTDLRYLVLLSIFSFFWSIVGARTFAIISDADHSGKYINIAQATVGIGYIIGPMIAAELVIDFKYLGVNMLGVIAFMCCFVLMLPLAKKGRE